MSRFNTTLFLQLNSSLNEFLPNVPSTLHDGLRSLLEIDYKKRSTSQNFTLVSGFSSNYNAN